MAMTDEQQSQLDLAIATQKAQAEIVAESEASRREHEMATEQRRVRLEMVRTARETLIENKRNLPVAERQITEDEIIEFAETLINFVNK